MSNRIDSFKTTRHPIIVVQGAQYGSEAKGMVAAALCEQRNIHYAVRTGAVNAGHTVYYKGKAYKMQQLATGWTNPGTNLVIGAGAYVNPAILQREIKWIADATGYDLPKIYLDKRVGLHLEEHTARSTASGRHHAMGATGKGCSEAIVDKIKNRGREDGRLLIDWIEEEERDETEKMLASYMTDTEMVINNAYDGGAKILIEGTQGQLLDLHLGPYPYVTHKQTGPANWLSEVGLSPNLQYEIALVVRTFPIRVAGNSGPMPNEVLWEEVAGEINSRAYKMRQNSRVNPEAIREWEQQCVTMAKSKKFELPTIDNHRCHHFNEWSEKERIKYKVALSEFHKAVFEVLTLEVQEELKQVFEFTTVTNKLRRVARLDIPTLKISIRQARPSYLVVTFLNYLFPELWNKREINRDAKEWIKRLEDEVLVKVRYVSTGAESQHLVELN